MFQVNLKHYLGFASVNERIKYQAMNESSESEEQKVGERFLDSDYILEGSKKSDSLNLSTKKGPFQESEEQKLNISMTSSQFYTTKETDLAKQNSDIGGNTPGGEAEVEEEPQSRKNKKKKKKSQKKLIENEQVVASTVQTEQENINLDAKRHSSGEEDNVIIPPAQEKTESPKKGIEMQSDILVLPTEDRAQSPDPKRHTSGVSENSASKMMTSQDWARVQTIKAMRQSSGTEDNLKWSVSLRGQRVDSREAKKQSSGVVEESLGESGARDALRMDAMRHSSGVEKSMGESGVKDALRMDAMRHSSGPDTMNESSRKENVKEELRMYESEVIKPKADEKPYDWQKSQRNPDLEQSIWGKIPQEDVVYSLGNAMEILEIRWGEQFIFTTGDGLKIQAKQGLEAMRITNQTLEAIFLDVVREIEVNRLKHPKRLDIDVSSCPQITNKGLENLGINLSQKMKNIERLALNFSGCYRVTDSGALDLAQKIGQNLRSIQSINLNFSRCAKLTDEGISKIPLNIGQGNKQLQRLTLSFLSCSKLTDRGLEELTSNISKYCPNVQELALDFSMCLCLTDKGIKIAGQNISSNLEKLEHLHLSFGWCQLITPRGVQDLAEVIGEHIENLKDLKHITLSSSLPAEKLNRVIDYAKDRLSAVPQVEIK